MWTEFECETWFVAEPPLARQHFSSFVVWLPWVLLDARALGKLFPLVTRRPYWIIKDTELV
jgi:hypothetical protein